MSGQLEKEVVLGPSKEIGRGLAAVYRHVLDGAGSGPSGMAMARLAMYIEKQGGPPEDNCPVTRAAHALGHLGFFEHQIDRLYGQVVAPRLVLQAAAVWCEPAGVLLTGAPGSGRSSLAALLVKRGLGYVADSFVCLDSAGGPRTWGHWTKAVALKGDLPEGLAEVTPCASYVDGRELVRYFDPEHLRAGGVVREPVPIRTVVFPRFEPGGAVSLRPMTPGETVMALNANVVRNGSSFERLVDVGRRARVFRLEFGRVEDGCDAVIEAVEHAARVQAG